MKTAQGFRRTEGKKAGMPLGGAGLGSAPAEFQTMPLLPAQVGSLLPKGLWLSSKRTLGFQFPL